jgi:hypothetical protein
MPLIKCGNKRVSFYESQCETTKLRRMLGLFGADHNPAQMLFAIEEYFCCTISRQLSKLGYVGGYMWSKNRVVREGKIIHL